jgi:hypothetical protein
MLLPVGRLKKKKEITKIKIKYVNVPYYPNAGQDAESSMLYVL